MWSHAESPVPDRAEELETGDWGPADWCASGTGGGACDSPEVPLGPAAAPAPPGPARPTRSQARRQPQGQARADGAGGGSGHSPDPVGGDPVTQARAICLQLLTGAPRTRRQLADALRRRGIPEDAAEDVLSRLEGVGLIDDAAFAGAWVESRHTRRGLARRALARELRSRGVSGAVVEDAVARLDPDQEAETARTLVDRKLHATRGLDRQVRIRRLAGMLARRGYPEGLALRVVREALTAEGEDTEELDGCLPGDADPVG